MGDILERATWAGWARSAGDGDGDTAPPLRKQLTATVKGAGVSPDTGLERFDFTASTAAVDREGDIIEPGGWELEDYRRNPVILWAHDYSAKPIGRSVKTGVRGGALRVRVEFTPETVNPDGYRVHQLVEAGFLRSVSVGFRPLEFAYNSDHEGYDFKRAELLEVSVVPVPANQEALIAAGVGGDTVGWFARQLNPAPTPVLTEDEVREIITATVAETVGGGVALDITEAELRETMFRAMADEITRTTGRLVDPPDDPAEVATQDAVRAAIHSALEAATGGGRAPETELRAAIEAAVHRRLAGGP